MSLLTSIKGLREILAFDNRFQLIWHHIFNGDDKLSTYRFSKFQVIMLKSGGDLNGMRACIATRQYKQFFDRMELDKPLQILDLGAHTGGFIFAFLSEGYEVSKSISVEQNERTYSRLFFNMALNKLQECETIHGAVWSEKAQLLSSGGAGRTSASVEIVDQAKLPGQSSIRGFSVNGLIDSFDDDSLIDVCKIDVEGAEWEIFSHLDSCSLLPARCRYLIIEIHPSDKHNFNLVALIEQHGFKLLAKCRYGDDTYLFESQKLSA